MAKGVMLMHLLTKV